MLGLFLDIATWILMLSGCLFLLITGVGLLRLPDIYTRIHAGGMAAGDGLLASNFRADRMRQILTALVDPDFAEFERSLCIDWAAACGMVEYSSHLNGFLTCLFPSIPLEGILGEVVADAGLSQLRIAETEKYAHVTFFLNGGREANGLDACRISVL